MAAQGEYRYRYNKTMTITKITQIRCPFLMWFPSYHWLAIQSSEALDKQEPTDDAYTHIPDSHKNCSSDRAKTAQIVATNAAASTLPSPANTAAHHTHPDTPNHADRRPEPSPDHRYQDSVHPLVSH